MELTVGEMREAVVELRCTWRFSFEQLLLDCELIGLDEDSGAEVLCHGAEVLRPTGFGAEALAWLHGRLPDWPGDPALFPWGGLGEQWGRLLASCLAVGVGPSTLDRLFVAGARRSGALVRLSSRALDPVSARLPIETLIWPLDASTPVLGTEQCVSIVRVPGRVEARGVDAKGVAELEPGLIKPMVLSVAGDANAYGLGDFLEIVAACAGGGPFGRVGASESYGDFTSFTEEVRRGLSEADLLVLSGHGNGHHGFRVAGREEPMGGVELAEGLDARPTSVIVAMCGSAMAAPPNSVDALEPSVVETLSRSGVQVCVGFQGSEIDLGNAQSFVRTLCRTLRAGARLEPFSLSQLERAISRARRAIPMAAAPVVFVHPGLLSGRRPGRTSAARGGLGGEASGTAWYVPGQIAFLSQGGRMLRIPLPVDFGVDLHVQLGTRGDGGIDPRLSLQEADLGEIREAWPAMAGFAIRVSAVGGDLPKGWGNRSAEMSALLRTLAVILEQAVPPSALRLIDATVSADWGTHDAIPRIVEVHSGQRVARFDGVLAGVVTPVELRPPPKLPYSPLDLESVAVDAQHLLGPDLDGPWFLDGKWAHDQIELQRRRAHRATGMPRWVRDIAEVKNRVLIPAGATVELWSPESGATGVRLAGVRARQGRVPDDLLGARWSPP